MNNKSFLIILGGLLAAVLVIAVGILPLNSKIKEKRAQSIELKAKADTLEKKAAVLKFLKKEFAQKKDLLNKLAIALPAENKLDEVFVMLDVAANESGVVIKNISPDVQRSGGAEKTAAKSLIVKLTAVGEYNNLINFEDNLKKLQRPMFVKSVTMAALETKEDTTSVSATYEVEILKSAAGSVNINGSASPNGTAGKTNLTTEGL